MPAGEARPEVLAFLADVKEHPREDGLRLILADWLEEFGSPLDQARAELIRCQVDFGRLPPEEPRRSAAGRRARELQQKHGRDWLGPLVPWLGTWACQRGLISACLNAASLRARALRAEAAGEAWAWVEEVCLQDAEDEHLAPLADNPLFAALAGLRLLRGRVGPAGLQALGRQPWLRRLVLLDLGGQPLDARGLAALLASPHLGRLEVLELAAAGLGRAEAGQLAALGPAALRRLVLWGNQLGDDGARALLSGDRLTRLDSFDLRGNGLGNAAARALADSAALAGLRELNLADNRIGPTGAAALANSAHLGGLEKLVLWGNPVGAESAALLRRRFGARVHVSPAS